MLEDERCGKDIVPHEEIRQELERVKKLEDMLEKGSVGDSYDVSDKQAELSDKESNYSDKEKFVNSGMNELKELEEVPRNVQMTKPGIKISEFPLDMLYNLKMERVRQVMNHKFSKVFPIEIVMMKSETTEVMNETEKDKHATRARLQANWIQGSTGRASLSKIDNLQVENAAFKEENTSHPLSIFKDARYSVGVTDINELSPDKVKEKKL